MAKMPTLSFTAMGSSKTTLTASCLCIILIMHKWYCPTLAQCFSVPSLCLVLILLWYAELPDTASALAEHTFFEYQRLVQKEAEPELIIQLPNRLEDPEDFKAPMIESEDASTHKDIEISVTVAFAIEQPKCGLFFHGKYGCTDNQVGT